MKIYNTLTRQKQEFVPINKGEVKMYSCGPTVYDYFHIGNARPFIVFDTMRRYLEYQGYKVTFVQNFTDIDDKMIKRANEEGITVKELGERFIAEYFKDAQAIGIHKATIHPKATENIDAIINVVKKLVDNGYAYDVDGNVYFSTKKFNEYGKLSKQPLEDLEAGARIDVNEHKKDVMDFALWKKQKEGEPAWESPWGMGRPGWHIECSAMVNKYLGETIDIHSGGQDLIFPHHENEIAQSECANGKPFANYWMHNGYININNQKMSKSLGNCIYLSEEPEEIQKKIMSMYTDPGHLRVQDPGKIEGNTVFTYLDAFCLPEHFERYLPDYPNLAELKAHYQRGGLGDVKVKRFLNSIMQEILEPIRNRRKEFSKDIPAIYDMLQQGCEVARAAAAETLADVKKAMKINYFDDKELIEEQVKRFSQE